MQIANGVFEYVLGAGVAVFPSLGFVYQYRLINARKSIGTFSINVCGVMFLSNFLRIAFFIYKEFSLALLLQSVLNIIMQILLLYLCVNTMNSQGYFNKAVSQVNPLSQSWVNNFWKWRKISNYLAFIGLQAILLFYLGYIIRIFAFQNAGQMLGYASLTAQTFLLLPQLMQNLKQKQVLGISYVFVALNTFQDLLELVFVVIYKSQPFQFLLFNSLQVLTNVLLILQILFYKKCCSKLEQKESMSMGEGHHNFQEDMHILNGQQINKQIVIESFKQKLHQLARSQLILSQHQNQSKSLSEPISQ